jgi:sulfoxide reductase heme-binding subunit YedZ
VAKPLVFLACLVPALHLAAGALGIAGVSLGADPVKLILHTTGTWVLRLLAATLLMTPLRNLTGSLAWLRFRRMLGLYVFFYVLLHFSTYVFLDQDGKLSAIWKDIVKHPYVMIGFLGLLLLIPLAVTSTAKAQRRLGRGWARLHRLIYVIAALGVWHYWWLVKKDIRPPLAYAAVFAVLIGYRWVQRRRRQRRSDRGSAPHGLQQPVELEQQRLGAVPADAGVRDRYPELERS